jgi:nucleoside-diphosphate-sugar epimerase
VSSPASPGGPRPHPAGGAVLVTGASGFIGGALVRRLSGEGRRVRCLVRQTSETGHLDGLAVEVCTGALEDRASLERAAAGCERVVHCAALVSDWATVKEIRQANVSGTRNVLAAATRAGVRRFVHLSTTDVYGHPGGTPDERARPAAFANWYARTKLEAEREVLGACATCRSPEAVVLRPATVYGPGSEEVVGEIARAIEGGHMLLVGRGRTNAGLCYVENLLDALVLAIDSPRAAGETFNVTDGLEVTWAQFAGDLAAGLGAPPIRLSLPYPVAAALARVLEEGYRLARGTTGLQTAPLLSRQAVQVLGREQRFDPAKARELLGWGPRVTYEQGLRETLAWLAGRGARGHRRAGREHPRGLDGAGAAL